MQYDNTQIMQGLDNSFFNILENIEIEIGCSRGITLSKLASQNPQNIYLGVEINQDRCQAALDQIIKHGLKNVFIINCEGYHFLKESVPSQSIFSVHVYFPNPHQELLDIKGRLVDYDFINEVYRILKKGGIFRLLTDHLKYFTEISNETYKFDFWQKSWVSPFDTNNSDYFVGTTSEKKYYNLGKKINYLFLIK